MRIPDYMNVIEGGAEEPANDEDTHAQVFELADVDSLLESNEGTGSGAAPRPRRRRLPRAPSWARAPRPSDPPPMRAC